jgi:hypothetical protein
MLTFVCNSLSAVSLSALFFWNQLTALSEGCLYLFISHDQTAGQIHNIKVVNKSLGSWSSSVSIMSD